MLRRDSAVAAVTHVFAIVPVKPFDEGKSRLSAILNSSERQQLNAFLLRRTLEQLVVFPGPSRTIVVSRSESVLAEARRRQMIGVSENGKTLNEALVVGAQAASDRKAGSILIVPTDLPLVEPDALARVANTSTSEKICVLVTDRRGRGTNILFLRPPREDIFAFGEDSFLKHQKIARRHGLEVLISEETNLAFDIDEPEDYHRWVAMGPRVTNLL